MTLPYGLPPGSRRSTRPADQNPFAFITIFGRVGGIVTRADLQKPPVRKTGAAADPSPSQILEQPFLFA
jgi:hypothetical protein